MLNQICHVICKRNNFIWWIFEEYFYLIGIETHPLQSELCPKVDSNIEGSHALTLFPLTKHNSVFEYFDEPNFQVSSETHSNILMLVPEFPYQFVL